MWTLVFDMKWKIPINFCQFIFSHNLINLFQWNNEKQVAKTKNLSNQKYMSKNVTLKPNLGPLFVRLWHINIPWSTHFHIDADDLGQQWLKSKKKLIPNCFSFSQSCKHKKVALFGCWPYIRLSHLQDQTASAVIWVPLSSVNEMWTELRVSVEQASKLRCLRETNIRVLMTGSCPLLVLGKAEYDLRPRSQKIKFAKRTQAQGGVQLKFFCVCGMQSWQCACFREKCWKRSQTLFAKPCCLVWTWQRKHNLTQSPCVPFICVFVSLKLNFNIVCTESCSVLFGTSGNFFSRKPTTLELFHGNTSRHWSTEKTSLWCQRCFHRFVFSSQSDNPCMPILMKLCWFTGSKNTWRPYLQVNGLRSMMRTQDHFQTYKRWKCKIRKCQTRKSNAQLGGDRRVGGTEAERTDAQNALASDNKIFLSLKLCAFMTGRDVWSTHLCNNAWNRTGTMMASTGQGDQLQEVIFTKNASSLSMICCHADTIRKWDMFQTETLSQRWKSIASMQQRVNPERRVLCQHGRRNAHLPKVLMLDLQMGFWWFSSQLVQAS